MAEPAPKLSNGNQPGRRWRPTVIQGGGEGSGSDDRPRGHLQAVPNADDTGQVYDKPGSQQDDRHLHAVPDLQEDEEGAEDDQATQADKDEADQLQESAEEEDDENEDDDNEQLYNPEDDVRRFKMSVAKRRAVGVAIALGLITGGGTGAFFIVKPALELVHLGALFSDLDWRTNRSTASRLRRFKLENPLRCRLGGNCSTIGETRVTRLGSNRFHRIRGQLENAGITFERNQLDRPTAMTIDTNRNPVFRDEGNLQARRQAVANYFGVDVDTVGVVSGTGVLRIGMEEMGIKSLRALTFSALRTLKDGPIATSLNKRIFSRFFGIPNLFHPRRRIPAELEQRADISAARREAENERRRAQGENVNQSLPDKYRNAMDTVRSNVSPNVATQINRAMFVADALCAIRSIADAIPLVNYANIVIPSVVAATDKMAVGSSIQAGQTSVGQVGSVVGSMVDEDGRSIWSATAMNELVYRDGGRGIDIETDVKQAFTSYTTGNAILDWLRQNGITSAACSDVGQIVVTAIDVILTVVTVSGWKQATAAGTSSAASMLAVAMVQSRVVDALSEDPVSAFAGPKGGNLLAYGARYGSNLNALAMGGIALARTETFAQQKEHEKEQQKQFQQKNFFARMFDIHEPKSFAANMVRSSNTSPTRAASNLASGFMNIGQIFSKAFGAVVSPQVAAQADEPYDWGFPIYGVPQHILDNDSYANPYENAELAAEIFEGDRGDEYIQKAKDCFGVEIMRLPVEGGDELWSVVPDEQIDPTDDNYTEADCGNLGDSNWARVLVFVFDTSLITLIECYEGDQDSCFIMRYGVPEDEGDGGGTPTDPTGCPTGAVDRDVEQHIITVEGTQVHNCIADQFGRMVNAARQDGIDISGGGGWRSLDEQIALRRAHCGTSDYAIYEMPSSQCNPPTATPGNSMHQRGLAIDFRECNSQSTACWGWLNQHAAGFGFYNLESEPWHWSTNGN